MLDPLISKTKQRILAATLLQPERSWYLLELARHLGVRPSSLQRDLKLLTEAGILQRRQSGNRIYFQADPACPIFQELTQILVKTVGLVEVLREALHPLQDRIELAFVYGSVASSTERSTSDVDLLVIGAAPLSEIASVLRAVERHLGRAVNPTVYRSEEFTRKLGRRDHFLTSLLGGEPLFIVGTRDDLANLASGATDQAASDERSRTRRPPSRR